MTFGEKIREARKNNKLTQKQLAEKIGAAHNSISDWEKDKNKPDPDTIELLCGVLDITPNYLLSSSSNDFSPSEKLIIKKYRSLDPHSKDLVDTVLDKAYERCIEIKEESESSNVLSFPDRSYLEPDAAHDRADLSPEERTAELMKAEDDIMDDENF